MEFNNVGSKIFANSQETLDVSEHNTDISKSFFTTPDNGYSTLYFLDNGWSIVNTPYYDWSNDCIQIYIKQKDKKITFSDDSFMFTEIELHGILISGLMYDKIKNICTGFGIRIKEDTKELVMTIDVDEISMREHDLPQCILAIAQEVGLKK